MKEANRTGSSLPKRHQIETVPTFIQIIEDLSIIKLNGRRKACKSWCKRNGTQITTKAEIYKVLVTSGSIYLTPVDQTNGDFIRDILSRNKLVRHKFIFKYGDWNKVRIIEEPHIEGLHIPELLKFAEKHWAIEKYMPDY